MYILDNHTSDYVNEGSEVRHYLILHAALCRTFDLVEGFGESEEPLHQLLLLHGTGVLVNVTPTCTTRTDIGKSQLTQKLCIVFPDLRLLHN